VVLVWTAVCAWAAGRPAWPVAALPSCTWQLNWSVTPWSVPVEEGGTDEESDAGTSELSCARTS